MRLPVPPGPRGHQLSLHAVKVVAGALLLAPVVTCGWVYDWIERRPAFHSVTPPVAFEILRDNPSVPILDLRTEEEFHGALGHLHRAINIPLEQLPPRLGEISVLRTQTFVVYCRDDACGREGMAVLVTSGFDAAILMEGGIVGWVRAGFPTVGAGGSPGTGSGESEGETVSGE